MRPFVESLRRLYHDPAGPRVSLEKLQGYLASGKITQVEYDYIIS